MNSQFNSTQTDLIEVGNSDWRNADQGWLVSSNSKWSENLSQENVTADNTGASALTQIITSNSLNQGLQFISFDAINQGNDDNTLRLQIYGIDGDFRMGVSGTDAPNPRRADIPMEYSVLLDTGNIASQQFDYSTFSQLVRFW